MKLRVLSAQEVAQAVTMAEAMHAVREAYVQLSAGLAEVPLRTPVHVSRHQGVTLFMPAYLARTDALGAKIVSVFPENPKGGLPTIHAIIVLVDAETGVPVALLDASYLTALRTGAASGVATGLLARQDARVAAVFGAGAQGRTQLEAICELGMIEEALVYDVVPKRAEQLIEDLISRRVCPRTRIGVARTPCHAVEDADIVCTATTSHVPVFSDANLKPGVHINGIGSYTPEMQEIPSETVIRARVFVDSRPACLAEAGDLVKPLKAGLIEEAHIAGEIGEVAAGRVEGRISEESVTIFKSVGVAVQDIAVATLILARASDRDLGTVVEV